VNEDFMFSVLHRFAYHPDRVRVTFTHFSELNLVAVQRAYLALLGNGMEPVAARKEVESVAHRAWRSNIDFIRALAGDDEVTSRLSVEQIMQIRDEVWQDSQANARRAADALAAIPGGHGPMVDLADNADVGRVLRASAGLRPSSSQSVRSTVASCLRAGNEYGSRMAPAATVAHRG
jgi:hypothetical protein